jgi:hypothetical protein
VDVEFRRSYQGSHVSLSRTEVGAPRASGPSGGRQTSLFSPDDDAPSHRHPDGRDRHEEASDGGPGAALTVPPSEFMSSSPDAPDGDFPAFSGGEAGAGSMEEEEEAGKLSAELVAVAAVQGPEPWDGD